MLDAEIAALFGTPAPMPALTRDLIGPLRANMAAMGKALPGVAIARVEDFYAEGVPVRLYHPGADGPAPLLVFLHGGGWFLGDLDTHDAMCRHLAHLAGCAVLAVGYRLAPEHPFPAALDDAETAFAWARNKASRLGCDPARIALGGESAGANLTAALTLRLRDQDRAQPPFQLVIHPVTDLTFALPAISEVEVPGLSRDYLVACAAMYLGETDASDPLVSPLHAASLAGLPPAIVLTAEEDPLRDDGEFYAAALARAGVETLAQRLPGLPHGFLFLPITLGAVDRAYRLIAGLLRRYFAG